MALQLGLPLLLWVRLSTQLGLGALGLRLGPEGLWLGLEVKQGLRWVHLLELGPQRVMGELRGGRRGQAVDRVGGWEFLVVLFLVVLL